jgi:hypothetical protein
MCGTLKSLNFADERNKLVFGPHAGFGVAAMKDDDVGNFVVAEAVSMKTGEKADTRVKVLRQLRKLACSYSSVSCSNLLHIQFHLIAIDNLLPRRHHLKHM